MYQSTVRTCRYFYGTSSQKHLLLSYTTLFSTSFFRSEESRPLPFEFSMVLLSPDVSLSSDSGNLQTLVSSSILPPLTLWFPGVSTKTGVNVTFKLT